MAASAAHPDPGRLTLPRPGLWPVILLTGAAAGLLGGSLMRLLRAVQHLCYRYSQGDFLSAVAAVSPSHRVLVLACAGLFSAAVLLALHRARAKEVDINEAVRHNFGRLPEIPTAIRAVFSIIVVAMGAAIGREQALKQAGALAAARAATFFRLTLPERRLLVACGIGAGMAAAYNVPFGGALFTLEVLLDTVSLPTALAAFATSFTATAVSWLLLPNQPTYTFPALPTTPSLILWSLLAGPLLGLASVAFVRLIHWSKQHKPTGPAVVLFPVASLLALGLAAIRFPQLLGNGKGVVQLTFDTHLTTALLCWLFILRPLATAACLRAGIPGGLFTPTMTFGALAGAVLGQPWSHAAPATDKRSYALIGAGAVLAAANQAPISSIAFTLELTGTTWPLIVPLLIATAAATLTFRSLETRSTNVGSSGLKVRCIPAQGEALGHVAKE